MQKNRALAARIANSSRRSGFLNLPRPTRAPPALRATRPGGAIECRARAFVLCVPSLSKPSRGAEGTSVLGDRAQIADGVRGPRADASESTRRAECAAPCLSPHVTHSPAGSLSAWRRRAMQPGGVSANDTRGPDGFCAAAQGGAGSLVLRDAPLSVSAIPHRLGVARIHGAAAQQAALCALEGELYGVGGVVPGQRGGICLDGRFVVAGLGQAVALLEQRFRALLRTVILPFHGVVCGDRVLVPSGQVIARRGEQRGRGRDRKSVV